MGVTAVQLINQAASKIGVGGRGKTLAPDELFDWLIGLRQMLDGWALEELMIPVVTRETFTLADQRDFTIGLGGDFDTERPLEILSLEIVDANGGTCELRSVPLGTWNRAKTQVAATPRMFYYEDGYPLATIRFDRKPIQPRMTLVSKKPLEVWQLTDLNIDGTPDFAGQRTAVSELSIDTLQANIEFDRGYESAIVFNLAVVMAPDYDKAPSQIVMGLANQYKQRIKSQNVTIPNMTSDSAWGGGHPVYDINEGPVD